MSLVKTQCALQVFVLELISFVRFFPSFWDQKNTSLFSSFKWEIQNLKNDASLRENTKEFDRAQINAHDAMDFDWGNPILANTTHHCTQTHRNLTERRQTGTMDFDRAQPNADDCRKHRSCTRTYSRVEKFSKNFLRSESVRDQNILIFVKNSSHQRLLATTKRRKGALLMVHSAWTLTVPLRLSLVSFLAQAFVSQFLCRVSLWRLIFNFSLYWRNDSSCANRGTPTHVTS